jgi:nucleoside-diphosphate-sugar epimerase
MRILPPHCTGLVIFGAGYTGGFLAQACAPHVPVFVTTRDNAKNALIQGWGASLLPFGAPLPPHVSHAVVTNPPLADGTDPTLTAYGDALKKCTWVGYLSSTGVYGDHNGGTVTETSPLLAAEARSLARKQAEAAWLAAEAPVEVFRLSGIYGPGRNMLERLKNGAIGGLEQSDRPVNRIHVADIVQVLLAAMAKPRPKVIYNLADDLPAPTAEVIAHAAHLLGVPVPATGSGASHLMDGSRKVDNTKIKRELGVILRYPTYRDGLAAALD